MRPVAGIRDTHSKRVCVGWTRSAHAACDQRLSTSAWAHRAHPIWLDHAASAAASGRGSSFHSLAMSNPIKHHYIPQSILSRFCDAEGLLCTFNKQIGKRGKKRHPAGVCYEENLHTLIYEDEKFTGIESFYSQIEDKFLEILKTVDDGLINSIDIAPLQKQEEIYNILSLFLTLSFWRVPKRSDLAINARSNLRKIYDRAPAENRGLIKYDRKLIRDIERKNASTSIKIAQFIALPALLADAKNPSIRKCWFYPTEFNQAIADDPIVCDLDDNFMLAGEIYIPVGSRLCITNSPNKISKLHEKMFSNAVRTIMASSEECFSILHKNG